MEDLATGSLINFSFNTFNLLFVQVGTLIFSTSGKPTILPFIFWFYEGE